MILGVQIISLVVSFCYGIFFYLTLELNSKLLYTSRLWLRIIVSFLFVLFHTLLYFLILMKINYGYVHVYFFLCMIGGYWICKVVYKKIVKCKKVWYTLLKYKVGDTVVKKRKKYTVKTKGRMLVIFLFFGAIISTLGYTLVLNLKQVNDMKKELKALEEEKVFLLEQEEATEADIKRLSDPLYIARYAREKYFYSREGELILRIKE